MKYVLFVLMTVVVVALLVHFELLNILVDYWWYSSLGYKFYFWQRLINRYLLFALITLLFFAIFFFNFWLASWYLGSKTSMVATSRSWRYRIYKGFQRDSFWIFTGLSLLFAIIIGIPVFQEWQNFLLYLAHTETGIADPLYHKDVSYYLFSYPIYTLLQNYLLAAFIWLLVCLGLLYWFKHSLLAREEQELPAAPRWHLSIIVLITFLIGIWHYVLERYYLLYSTKHLPLFSGPGFTEINWQLPLIWCAIVALAVLALACVYYIHRQRGRAVIIISLLLFVIAVGSRYVKPLETVLDEYVVKPNSYKVQKKYIEYNIGATLDAYKLRDVEIRDFNPSNTLTQANSAQVQDTLKNVPLWDPELLRLVYEQRQELRGYYDFAPINVNRFMIDGQKRQSFLAARELTFAGLTDSASTWINRHLFYTHGYGVVMTPAARDLDEMRVWYLKGIPLESTLSFNIAQPRLYFGVSPAYDNFAIAPNQLGEFDYPAGNDNTINNYTGKDGVPIHSLIKRLILAYYFRDKNLIFTTKTIPASRILFRRNVIERIRTLAPFLQLDTEPYIAVTSKGVYWIQDAYTISDYFPYAAMESFNGKRINYVRNSVKIIADAYNGTVDLYITDPQDPIIRAYRRIYPSLFKNFATMPAELKAQVRYPRDIFTAQMRIYAKYHQRDPRVFYQQEDQWDFALFHRSSKSPPEPLKPYYITLDLIQPGKWDFQLLAPFTPYGRDNLRALTMVDCDGAEYGKIVVYYFPKGELSYGPSQVYALINQDPRVSELLSLWDQAGSKVERGRITVLPIGKSVIYIQPLYLASTTALEIPQLQRVIMTYDGLVEIEPTLEQAYSKLAERLELNNGRFPQQNAPGGEVLERIRERRNGQGTGKVPVQ